MIPKLPFKIKVDTPEKSERVQKFLFKHGIKWSGQYTRVQYTDKPHLYIYEEKQMYQYDNEQHFNEHTHPEITYEQLFSPKWSTKFK